MRFNSAKQNPGEIAGMPLDAARAITARQSLYPACLAHVLTPAAQLRTRHHCAGTRQKGPAICSRGRPGSLGRRS